MQTDAIQKLSIEQVMLKVQNVRQLWLQLNYLTTALFEHLAVACAGPIPTNNATDENTNTGKVNNFSLNNISYKRNNYHLFSKNVTNGVE